MRNRYLLSVITITCILGLSTILAATAGAEVPELINYQGRLTDALGSPLDTTVSMTFTIYDDSLEGEELWSETKLSVTVTDGLFNVTLGVDPPVGADLFMSPNRYLGITVGDDAEIAPRTRLVSTAYAHHAVSSDTAGFAYTIADDSVTSGKIATGAVTGDKIAVGAVGSEEIEEGAVTSLEIEDGAIQFVDIGPNDAETGQLMKWNGSAWSAADDETCIPAGWVDDGDVVSLETATDSVGIGTSTPSERLDVDGNIRSSGTITSGHSLTIDGTSDMITATGGTIDFDDDNLTTTGKVSIGPGHGNSGTNAFVVGESNMITGQASTVAGGKWNVVDGDFSAISGGFGDTIASTADYSYLFGIGSKLTEDSTFMIDIPHIRFGDESEGYEFPLVDGEEGQVMTTDGVGVLAWADPPGAVWSNQGTWIKLIDVSDNVNVGGSMYPSEKLQVTGDLRVTNKANIGLNTTNIGIYAFVAGEDNSASGNHSAVSGGTDNSAGGAKSVVGGGRDNSAGGSQSTVSGGAYNTATGGYSTVSGGRNNSAIGDYAFAAGKNSKANHEGAVVISAAFSVFESDSVRSGGLNQMVLRADGGMYITNGEGLAPYTTTRLINTSTGAYLSTGGTWTNAPPRSFGENFARVDGEDILDKIAQLSIAKWSYETDEYTEDHIGPAAEEFNALFGVGGSDDGISTIDPAGIALAAIQELHKKTQEIDELRAQVIELQRIVNDLAAQGE